MSMRKQLKCLERITLHNGCPDCHEISPGGAIECCPKHWAEIEKNIEWIHNDDFHDVAGANVPGVSYHKDGPASNLRPVSTRKLKCIDVEKWGFLLLVREMARVSAELAPRVPDGNGFGYDWTIPNPVIGALAALDAWEKENGGTA